MLTATSTIQSDDYQGLASSNVTDGNTSTKWASNSTLPYLGLAFGSQVTPALLGITTSSDSYYSQTITEAEIEYSSDGGSTWHYVCGMLLPAWTGSSQTQTFTIPAV